MIKAFSFGFLLMTSFQLGAAHERYVLSDVVRVSYDYGQEQMLVDRLDSFKPSLPNPGIERPLRVATK